MGFRVLKIDYLRRTRSLLFATLSCESAFGTGRERQVNPVSAGSKPGYADYRPARDKPCENLKKTCCTRCRIGSPRQDLYVGTLVLFGPYCRNP